MAGLSELAAAALLALDEGQVLNIAHRHARELIAARYAYEEVGRLRITEAGRIRARRRHVVEHYEVDDPNVANLYHAPAAPAALVAAVDREVARVRAPPEPEAIAVKAGESVRVLMAEPLHGWDRARAQRAAGKANGDTGVWVSPEWVLAFLNAYETNGG